MDNANMVHAKTIRLRNGRILRAEEVGKKCFVFPDRRRPSAANDVVEPRTVKMTEEPKRQAE